jgi:23S rRNA pseudouridine2605 synthase
VVYSLRSLGELSAEQHTGILGGQLDRGTTLRVIRIEGAGGSGSNRWYQIETIGASGNDLRQLLERQAVIVSRLMRVRLGALQLERSMPRGRWRELLPVEIDSLLKSAALASPGAGNPDSAR